MPEAQAVIHQFQLKRVESESDLFPVYESADARVGLVISGIGKVNAAAATACLAASTARRESGAVGWLNFGIAGCGDQIYGETVLAGKVTDPGSERSWFPAATWPKRLDPDRREVITVDRPVSDYPEDGALVEMESAGYFPIALRSSSIELVQVIKVISDDPDHSIEDINKKVVTGLCRASLDSVAPWLVAFQELIELEDTRLRDPVFMKDWTDAIHFSVTQRHQLRRLLAEWAALSENEGLKPLPGLHDARSALNEIRKSLTEVRNELSA
ncbi:MAG: hypothetical protein P1U68_04340 [Verrucomicrobiales bacterium]|nr:hypothetical protein [Verrucomicrobiales bacterium]